MNINLLLKYHDFDKKLSEIEERLCKTQEYKDLDELQKSINSLGNDIKVAELEVKDAKESYDEFLSKTKELNSRIETAFSRIDLADTLEHLELENVEVSAINNEIYGLNQYEKSFTKMGNIKEQSEVKKNERQQLYLRFLGLKKGFTSMKLSINEKIVEPILNEMKELDIALNEEEKKYYYLAKNAVKKFPFICEYKDGFCGGCQVYVEAEIGKCFKNTGDIYKCPNCQRILYKK